MSSDGVKLYESGTPKLNLLFCISSVYGADSRRIESREISFVLCVSCVILVYLSLCCALSGSLGRLGRLLRIIEPHRAVSGRSPACVGDTCEVIKSEIIISRVIKRIGIAVCVLIVTAGERIDRGFKRSDARGNLICFKSGNSLCKGIHSCLILCHVSRVVEVADKLRSESIVGNVDKRCLICRPSRIRSRTGSIVASLTVFFDSLVVKSRKTVVIVDIKRDRL